MDFLYSEFDEYEEKHDAPLHMRYLRQSGRFGWPWPEGWMKWPAYHFTRIKLAESIQEAMRGYANAEDKGSWLGKSPYAMLWMNLQVMIRKREKARNGN